MMKRRLFTAAESKSTFCKQRDTARWKNGETPDGSRIEPLRADEDQGLIVFAYPSTDLDVYVPDHIGNVLHLAMKHK